MGDNLFYKGLIQGMTGGEGFPKDPIAAEDELFYRLGELVADQAITEDESMECWGQYIKSVRPDTHVIHLGKLSIPKAFYE